MGSQPAAAAVAAVYLLFYGELRAYGIYLYKVEEVKECHKCNASAVNCRRSSDASDSREINTLLCGTEFGTSSHLPRSPFGCEMHWQILQFC